MARKSASAAAALAPAPADAQPDKLDTVEKQEGMITSDEEASVHSDTEKSDASYKSKKPRQKVVSPADIIALLNDNKVAKAIKLLEKQQVQLDKLLNKQAKPKKALSEHNRFVQQTMRDLVVNEPELAPKDRMKRCNELWKLQKEKA